jgi:predicted SprT family Zn-dependent metalloprotease
MKTLAECEVFRQELMGKFFQAYPSLLSNTRVLRVTQLPIIFNNRMRSTLGRAFYKKWELHLNTQVLKEHPEQFNDTFAHELAHFLAYAGFGDAKHGRSWKHVMRVLGYRPERCHKLNVEHLRHRHPVLGIADCSCRENQIKARMFKKMKMGVKYRCRMCKQQLILREGDHE